MCRKLFWAVSSCAVVTEVPHWFLLTAYKRSRYATYQRPFPGILQNALSIYWLPIEQLLLNFFIHGLSVRSAHGSVVYRMAAHLPIKFLNHSHMLWIQTLCFVMFLRTCGTCFGCVLRMQRNALIWWARHDLPYVRILALKTPYFPLKKNDSWTSHSRRCLISLRALTYIRAYKRYWCIYTWTSVGAYPYILLPGNVEIMCIPVTILSLHRYPIDWLIVSIQGRCQRLWHTSRATRYRVESWIKRTNSQLSYESNDSLPSGE